MAFSKWPGRFFRSFCRFPQLDLLRVLEFIAESFPNSNASFHVGTVEMLHFFASAPLFSHHGVVLDGSRGYTILLGLFSVCVVDLVVIDNRVGLCVESHFVT